jgi:hypothetical protein
VCPVVCVPWQQRNLCNVEWCYHIIPFYPFVHAHASMQSGRSRPPILCPPPPPHLCHNARSRSCRQQQATQGCSSHGGIPRHQLADQEGGTSQAHHQRGGQGSAAPTQQLREGGSSNSNNHRVQEHDLSSQ